jgi:tetratricopeptide (TPR) repeat protein
MSDIATQAYKLMVAGRFAEALPLAQTVVAAQTACTPLHGLLATIQLRLGRRHDAESTVQQALDFPQASADAYDAIAHVSALLGQHDRSNALYRRTVELAPDDPRFWHNLASSERSLGRLREAEQACDRTLALDRARHATFLLRSELRVQTDSSNHVEELQRELARNGCDDRARMFLGYALAKELDDLKRYDEAFAYLADASKIRRRHLSYDVALDRRKLERIAAVFPSESTRTVRSDADGSRYLFIVGLPRSGTTLLEHMLLGLAGVRSNGETENFSQALLAASPRDRVDVFAGAAAANPAEVMAGYERLAGGETSIGGIIEKLPMNYLYLGAIHRAMPSARLILVNRAPLDSCFAMYRILFGEAYPFSYDLDELSRYYAAYERLMDHWRATLGGALCEVSYEELVTEPSRVGARVAAYCGLEWNDRAVEVHERSSVSLTASAAQIRRPIYSSSAGRWRHYKRHLERLAQGLRRERVPVPEDI